MSVGGVSGGARAFDDPGAGAAGAPAPAASIFASIPRPEIDKAMYGAMAIDKALGGLRADEKAILDVLERRPPREVALVEHEFMTHHGRDHGPLREVLRDRLAGPAEMRALRALDAARAAAPEVARESDLAATSPVYRQRTPIERATDVFWDWLAKFLSPLPS